MLEAMKNRNAAFLLCALLVVGCGGSKHSAREVFGMDRKSPDAFRVVSRPPLSVPKEFGLRPPSHAAQVPLERQADNVARQALLEKSSVEEVVEVEGEVEAYSILSGGTLSSEKLLAQFEQKTISESESAFLDKVGISDANAEIREQLGHGVVENKQTVWDALQGRSAEEPVVNAGAEAERIRELTQANEVIDAEGVKEINPSDRSPLEQLMSLF